ncbi:MAG: DUF4860 domain-containing protein [Acetatifactor sp.]|nr:DUF4860 domain-containing protein [Acetatifactor sp.]
MKHKQHYIVDILFVLTLFGIFAVSTLSLVLIGADVYQHTVNDMRNNYSTRAAVAFINEKIRQNDCTATSNGAVIEHPISIVSFDNTSALLLSQVIDEEEYYTYLYFYDGHLKELLTKTSASLGDNPPGAGQDIFPLDSFQLRRISEHLISVQLSTPGGKSQEILISTRSE